MEEKKISKIMKCQSGGTNGIPSDAGRESLSLAARVRTRYDVVEARASLSVQPGIEKTKHGLAVRKTVVIKQRDYARYYLDIGSQRWAFESGRRRAGGAGRSRERLTATAPFVPFWRVKAPSMTNWKSCACAAMSG